MTFLFEFVEVAAPPAVMGKEVSLLEFAALREVFEAAPVDLEAEVAGERARQVAVMVEAARSGAEASTRAALLEELQDRLEEERERVELVCDEFGRARVEYFRAAEREVVRLALAVAKRVLAREVLPGGLHLEAIVRAALAKVQDGSSSVLRVPVGASGAWREVLGRAEVEVVEEERFGEGRVVLETGVGSVELGIREQMEEVERGFWELMSGGMLETANADSIRE